MNAVASSESAPRTERPLSWPVSAASAALFEARYNLSNFLFQHELSGDPAFSVPSLIEFAERVRLSGQYLHVSTQRARVGDGWGDNKNDRTTLLETVRNIHDNNALVVFKNIEQDEVYGPLIRSVLDRLIELCGAKLRRDAILGRGTVLLASPGRITAYHFDSDANFLFQLAGAKTLHVFKQGDRSLVTDQQLERYYCGDQSAAVFKEERAREGTAYELDKGLGVHIPVRAPHWAQNHDSVSVALSVNFDLRSVEREARVYCFNAKLRRLGIQPLAPGKSRSRDLLKSAAMGGARSFRRILDAARSSDAARQGA